MTAGYRVGIDVGGTFTDLICVTPDGEVVLDKTPTTPEDQSVGVMTGLQLLAERGMLPPAVGMAVFGDLPIFSPTPLAVTLVSLPARHLGVTAADLLLKRINGDDQPPRTIVLRNQIVPSA